MFNGLKIKHLIEEKGLNFNEVFNTIGMSATTFYTIASEEGNPKADNLEKLADFLNVPIDYFFDRNIKTSEQTTTVNGNGNKVQNGNGNVMIENQAKEIEHLKQLLEEKEKSIQDKERTIQILLNQNK